MLFRGCIHSVVIITDKKRKTQNICPRIHCAVGLLLSIKSYLNAHNMENKKQTCSCIFWYGNITERVVLCLLLPHSFKTTILPVFDFGPELLSAKGWLKNPRHANNSDFQTAGTVNPSSVQCLTCESLFAISVTISNTSPNMILIFSIHNVWQRTQSLCRNRNQYITQTTRPEALIFTSEWDFS